MEAAARRSTRRMQELAQTPGVTVLEYDYDAQERSATPEVACELAREVFRSRRRDYAGLDDEAAARALVASSETLATFARSHPWIFRNVVETKNGAEALQMLERFARIRLEVATEEEGLVHANRVIMERTVRPMTAEEKAAAAVASPRVAV